MWRWRERCSGVRPCWFGERVDCECSSRELAIIYRSETKAWPPTVGAKRVIGRRPHTAVGPVPPRCRRTLSRLGRPRRRSAAAAASRHEVAYVSCIHSCPRDSCPARRALALHSPIGTVIVLWYCNIIIKIISISKYKMHV